MAKEKSACSRLMRWCKRDRDRQHHAGGVADDAGKAEPLKELEYDRPQRASCRLPTACGRARERIGVGNAVVLQDPLSRAQMPPDIGIVDTGGVDAHQRGRGKEDDKQDGLATHSVGQTWRRSGSVGE